MVRHEKSEWSHLINADDIGGEPKTYTFDAGERERIDLARRYGILSVDSAETTITIQQIGGGMFHAMGSIRAAVTQSCVVSLAPVSTHIEDEFEGWFGDKNRALSFAKAKTEREAKKGMAEIEILEESIDPEPIINGKMDIGELAAQYLSLSLDPYPHAPGVSSQFLSKEPEGGQDGGAIRKNPFEALKDWKEKR